MSVKYGSNRFFPRGDSTYVPSGAGLWTLYGGTVVGLTDITETVCIGGTTMLSDEKLRVLGGITSTPTGAGNDAFLEVGANAAVALSDANSARFIYNPITLQAEVSLNGGVYVPIALGAPSPWVAALGIITEINPGNLVVVGSGAALNADQFQVLGDSTLRPTVDSTAVLEVQDAATNARFQVDTVNHAAVVTGSFQMIGSSAEVYLESQPSTAPVSGAGAGRIRYNNVGTPSWQGSVNGGPWYDFITSNTISGTAFVQNGNTFGADAVLGTNDAFALQFETNNTTRARITSAGAFLIAAAAAAGTESLRVSGGGIQNDGTQNIVSVTSTLSLNNSGGPISIGNNADAQGINVGTGAAARSINIGNTTGATSIANSFGTNGFGLIQAAASSGTPVGVLMTAGAHTGLANAEVTDVNFNLARTVTFSGGGGAIASQRAFRIQAPTYAAAAAQTITLASTLEISGAPVQGGNVTFTAVGVATGAYALNVAGGPSRLTGAVYVRDTASPGTNGLYLTDSAGNGIRIFQNTTSQATVQSLGSNTLFVVIPSIAVQASIQAFADITYDIGTATSRFRDIYVGRTAVKNHAAFTGSQVISSSGAVQTTNAAATTAFTLAIPDNSCTSMYAQVVARNTATGDRAYYVIYAGVFRQAAGAATLITGTTYQPVAFETVAGYNADIVVSGNNAIVQVTGAVGATINWACSVQYQSVIGNT